MEGVEFLEQSLCLTYLLRLGIYIHHLEISRYPGSIEGCHHSHAVLTPHHLPPPAPHTPPQHRWRTNDQRDTMAALHQVTDTAVQASCGKHEAERRSGEAESRDEQHERTG